VPIHFGRGHRRHRFPGDVSIPGDSVSICSGSRTGGKLRRPSWGGQVWRRSRRRVCDVGSASRLAPSFDDARHRENLSISSAATTNVAAVAHSFSRRTAPAGRMTPGTGPTLAVALVLNADPDGSSVDFDLRAADFPDFIDHRSDPATSVTFVTDSRRSESPRSVSRQTAPCHCNLTSRALQHRGLSALALTAPGSSRNRSPPRHSAPRKAPLRTLRLATAILSDHGHPRPFLSVGPAGRPARHSWRHCLWLLPRGCTASLVPRKFVALRLFLPRGSGTAEAKDLCSGFSARVSRENRGFRTKPASPSPSSTRRRCSMVCAIPLGASHRGIPSRERRTP